MRKIHFITALFIILANCTATKSFAPGVGTTRIRPADGMVMAYVPVGEFSMGSDDRVGREICRQYSPNCSGEKYLDEEPLHTVYLDAYWIDRTEVTNSMYAACVSAGECQPPADTHKLPGTHYSEPGYEEFPVVNITLADAAVYCTWAGARLPDEAEWEKAARGTNRRIYPWGDSAPDCTLANAAPGFVPCVGDVSPVGTYPLGASPYGVLDMAGNVFEWVSDWYQADYYAQSPASNPQGPAQGEFSLSRGGSWNLNVVAIRTTYRQPMIPGSASSTVGFRCARSAVP